MPVYCVPTLLAPLEIATLIFDQCAMTVEESSFPRSSEVLGLSTVLTGH